MITHDESHFLAYVYRLQYIHRWSLMRNNQPENVAQHSFHAAILAHMLCSIAINVYHKDIPTEKVVCATLFHDVAEVMTGDIPTPIKHQNPQIRDNFKEIERVASQKLLALLPQELQFAYKSLLGEPAQHLLPWVKAADRLDAYLKCTFEILTGNREFVVAQNESLDALRRMDMPEVEYFLQVFAPSFAKTLDELFIT